MRVFLSHNINVSKNRPKCYRDSEDDVAALTALGRQLFDAGFRVFEYQSQRSESQTKDILFMMTRQIALSDVVVFVATRDSYDAPGWCVPELFHALALQKDILCCKLRDSQFNGEDFGDTSNAKRFRLLLATSTFHTPDSLVKHLRSTSEKLSQNRPLNFFDITEIFLSWQSHQPKGASSIEDLLETYASAWESGCRPLRSFLSASVVAHPGTILAKLSGWIDDDHIGVFWKGCNTDNRLTLLNTKTGATETTTLSTDIKPLGMGASETGESVVFSHSQDPKGIVFRRWHEGKWQSFTAKVSPAVFTGVIRDRWFCGSDLFRIDWENQCLVQENPTLKDWAIFRRFAWFDPPLEDVPSFALASIQPLLFTTQPEYWTLLPSSWRSLKGDTDENASRLIVWNKSQLLFGDIKSASSFGARLPRVDRTAERPPCQTGSAKPPRYLGLLCEEAKVEPPQMHPHRIESEDSLSLSWTANHKKMQCHFRWSFSLEEARQFLNDVLSIPALDSTIDDSPQTSPATR